MNNYDRLYGAPKKRFDRNSLPSPLQYLEQHGLLLRKPRSEWASIICPVHKGGAEKNASLNVSCIDGHFKCHTCGVKGGDILALHMLRTGQKFVDAVRALGGRHE
jgi:DNA primase